MNRRSLCTVRVQRRTQLAWRTRASSWVSYMKTIWHQMYSPMQQWYPHLQIRNRAQTLVKPWHYLMTWQRRGARQNQFLTLCTCILLRYRILWRWFYTQNRTPMRRSDNLIRMCNSWIETASDVESCNAFTRISPNTIIFNTLITACANNKPAALVDDALELFEMMHGNGERIFTHPEKITMLPICTLLFRILFRISGVCRILKFFIAVRWTKLLVHPLVHSDDCKPTVVTYSALINACANAKPAARFDDARNLWMEMVNQLTNMELCCSMAMCVCVCPCGCIRVRS